MGGLAPCQGGGNVSYPLINYQFSANSFMLSALSPHFARPAVSKPANAMPVSCPQER